LTHHTNPFIHDGEELDHASTVIKAKIAEKKAAKKALKSEIEEDGVDSTKAEKIAAVKAIAREEIADAEANGDYKAAKKAKKEAKKALKAEAEEDYSTTKALKKKALKKEAAEVASDAVASAGKGKKFQAGNKATAKEKAIEKVEGKAALLDSDADDETIA